MPQLALPEVHHVGIVVQNCLQAARSLSVLTGRASMPTFVDDYRDIEVAGVPTPFSLRLSFLDLGNVLLELLEPLDDRSPHAHFLRHHGGGLHHLGFRVDDLACYDQHLRDEGLEQIVNATIAPDASHWAYYGKDLHSGNVIELMEVGPANDEFMARVAQTLRQ
jgi:methylmalonyl-CoA/ethylmalonyl-CoA epimerase